jgi:uncharacterized protein (UPF0335 family)
MIDDKLISFISRIERLEEEERKLANDKWCVYAEAFMAGFNMNALEQLIAERKAQKYAGWDEDCLRRYRVALGTGVSPANDSLDLTKLPARLGLKDLLKS